MILNLILVAGLLVTMGLALGFFLSKNSISKKYLTPIFLLLSFEIFSFYAELHEHSLSELIGYLLSEGFGSLLSPLLWFYIRSIVNKPIKKRHLPYHFIFPILNLLLVVIPIGICLYLKSWIWEGYKIIAYNYDLYILLENTLSCIYLVFSLRVLFKHQKRIKTHFSQTTHRSLSWLKKICYCGIALILIDTSGTVYEHAFGELSWNIGFITIVALCFFLFYLSYHGFKQQVVIMPSFVYEVEESTQNQTDSLKERVYLKKFQESEVKHYQEKLLTGMAQQKFFLKSDLVLSDIATKLELTDKQTTELLNLELDTNFYDFINHYRVEEVKAKIASGNFENLTLLAIGLDSGFQSKSSFNRVFKKNTGVSPSEYKKSLSK